MYQHDHHTIRDFLSCSGPVEKSYAGGSQQISCELAKFFARNSLRAIVQSNLRPCFCVCVFALQLLQQHLACQAIANALQHAEILIGLK